MQTQFFCYVYAAPEGTPQMYALDANTLPEAVDETRRMMRDERMGAAFAEIWDGISKGMVERVEPLGLKRASLLRSVRRGRTFSRFSKP